MGHSYSLGDLDGNTVVNQSDVRWLRTENFSLDVVADIPVIYSEVRDPVKTAYIT